MERGSDQHGPRVDDAMATEVESVTRGAPVESRADEAREQEGSPAASGERLDEVHERSEIARHLRPQVFPATAPALVQAAIDESAPESLIDVLRRLPEGRRFENVEAAWEALGGVGEQRR